MTQLYTDASRGDEVIGLGWYVVLDDARTVENYRWIIGDFTSMEAEYYALLDGLRCAKRYSTGNIEVYNDCEPLIWKMEYPDNHNQTWRDRRRGCQRLLSKFESWELNHTPRACNTKADNLAGTALDIGRDHKT